MELAIRTAMTKLGAGLLQDLFALETGYRGAAVDCGAGHQAEFVSCRPKVIDTVLGGAGELRCQDASGRWDQIWPKTRHQTGAA